MENMDLQPNLALPMLEFEEKVDIDDLVLPPKPMKMVETEISDIIQEPLEEENKHAVLQLDFYVEKKFELKMEENILKLCEELDNEKSKNPTIDFSLRRSLKVSKNRSDFMKTSFLTKTNEIIVRISALWYSGQKTCQ